MSDELEQIRGLVGLLETRFAADQGRLAQHQAWVHELTDALNTLATGGRTATDDDPAFRAGAHLRWDVWAEERRRDLNRQLAEARAREEALKAELRISLGKLEAARGLSSELHAEALRRATRRHP